MRLAILTAFALVVWTPAARGQGVDDFADDLSDKLADAHFAKSLVGLVLSTEELELSGAHFDIDSEFETELSTLALPFQTTLQPWGEDRVGLHLEGVLGYARVSEVVGDVYSGVLPGLETRLESDWQSYGGFFGLGPEMQLSEELSLAAIAQVGLTRLENRTDYSGPGAAITSGLADGIAFNWDAMVGTLGTSLRMDWQRALGAGRALELIGRYDLRWTETLDSDDRAQEFSSRSQLVTVRAELTGPTGWTWLDGPVGWRASGGYRGFLEGDLVGVRDFFVLGGALELDLSQEVPLPGPVRVSGSLILGDDVSGWSAGLSTSL